jgi:hypothetical protein
LQGNNIPKEVYHSFGTIIVDECHHIPAKTFKDVIVRFYSYYLYGFTATPFRKNKDEHLIFLHIGDIIHETKVVSSQDVHRGGFSVVVRDTALFAPFNAQSDNFETLLHILIHDTARNEMIASDIRKEIAAGRKVLVLTERKAHVAILQQYLRGSTEVISLTGDDPAASRKSKLSQIEDGHFEVLITIGQFLGEGADMDNLDCLMLVYPFSFEGKLIQYIGRVQRGEIHPVIYDYRDGKIKYLENLFAQRNRYYRRIKKDGRLKPLEELLLCFNGSSFFIPPSKMAFSLDALELPLAVEKFIPEACWKIRVIQYDEETGELFCEIVNYLADKDDILSNPDPSFYYPGIERIKFRSMDTAGFLRSVILKRAPALQRISASKIDTVEQESREYGIVRSMKVPFSKLQFLYGGVSFPLFIEELGQELSFEIENVDIRPEFDAIRDYFNKALKKKLIAVDIAIRYTEETIISAKAKSEDISSINHSMIEGVRFEFIRNKIFKPGEGVLNSSPVTLEELSKQYHPLTKELFHSEGDLLDGILNAKKCKHYFQLKYLSSKHEASVLKLRFVLQPFSFLFLLSGQCKYYVVWETLDSEEATYIWSSDKTREALRRLLDEIELRIADIKKNGRQAFLKDESSNFSRIWHDYSEPKKGFAAWKATLEERLV